MSAIAQEVASQPACWKRAAELAAPLRDELGAPGLRVAVAGCGTSLYVAHVFAALREASGKGETDAFPASEFPSYRSYDRVVAITRSGTTTEVVQLLERLGDVPRTVVTADASSPVASLAETTIVLDFADERSVVQTRFATSALALFRAHLGQDLAQAIADGERALTLPLEPGPTGFDHVVFLGHGWTVGIAEEAALKLREATRTYSEAYPAMEYRHGPISLAGERSLVWILGSPDPGVGRRRAGDRRDRSRGLARPDGRAGARAPHGDRARRGQGPRPRSSPASDALGGAAVTRSRMPDRRCSS